MHSDFDGIHAILKSCDLTLAGIADAEFWLVRDDALSKTPKA
ncbi:MAG: hypothetical protein ACRECH_04795 [Nitrososphaerales archaeon]